MKDFGDKTGSSRPDGLPEPATQSPPSVTIPIAEEPGGFPAFNLVELMAWGDEEMDCAFDQPCAHGHRVDGHAVYCHNAAWTDAPRKCRRTWYTGGEIRDEDCPGFTPNAAQGIVTGTDETRSGAVEQSEIEPGPKDAPESSGIPGTTVKGETL